MYNLTPQEQIKLDKFLKENLDKCYIWLSQSPIGSPFFFVDKKDGKLRPCQDYQYLIIQSRMPIPYHWSVNSWTNSREHDDSLNWMFGGDTIMSGSEMGTNGKWPSKWTEAFLNQQWCSLECVTHISSNDGQHFQRYDQQLLCDHIHGQYFPLCTRQKDIDRKHQEGSNTFMRQQSIPETDQMQVQPDKGWILRTSNWRRKNLYGPNTAKRIQGQANPYNSQKNLRIFSIWELLLTIHLAFLEAGKATEWSPKEILNIQMDRQLPESIWRIEKAIYWRTSLNDARLKQMPQNMQQGWFFLSYIWIVTDTQSLSSQKHFHWLKWTMKFMIANYLQSLERWKNGDTTSKDLHI